MVHALIPLPAFLRPSPDLSTIYIGQLLEAQCEYVKARNVYEAILEEHPENQLAHRRILCVYKAQVRFSCEV